MIRLHFRPSRRSCLLCGTRLRAYKTTRKTVRSEKLDQFVAVHHLKVCPQCQKVFRSERLLSLVSPRCNFAHDVMVEAANQRFLKGRSCREIAQENEWGLSERHARRLSNEALQVLATLHEAKSGALSVAMDRWVLQIDGTVDGEYEVIVAVRDALSGFLLYAERCHSEGHQEIRAILQVIKERYGTPCAAISDMRAGILSALAEVFPGVPLAICRYHFLRDLGKDLLELDHVSLGKMLTNYGVRAVLKRALNALPKYAASILREVEHGYCTDPQALARMESRRALERALSIGERSGLGFPFTQRHLSFLEECLAILPVLVENDRRAPNEKVGKAVGVLQAIVKDPHIQETRERLKEVGGLFESLRSAMFPKVKGMSLSTEISLTSGEAQRQCREVVEMLGKALETLTTGHVAKASKKIISDYGKWEGHLFVVGLEGVVVPATNNRMEQVFRRMRGNVRKRCGDQATGRQLTLHGEALLLYQNMGNAKYVRAIFGEEEVAAVFGRERVRQPKVLVMGRKERERLLDKGTELLRAGKIPESPYEAQASLEGQHPVAISLEDAGRPILPV